MTLHKSIRTFIVMALISTSAYATEDPCSAKESRCEVQCSSVNKVGSAELVKCNAQCCRDEKTCLQTQTKAEEAAKPTPPVVSEAEKQCKEKKNQTACASWAVTLRQDDPPKAERLATQACKAKNGMGCAVLGSIRNDQGKTKEAMRLWEISCKLGVTEMCEILEKARQEVFEEKLSRAPQVTLMDVLTNPKRYENSLVSFSRVQIFKVSERIGLLQDDPPRNSINIVIPDDAPQSLRAKWACIPEGKTLFSVRPLVGVYKDIGYGEHVFLLLSIQAEVDCR
jgi:hypothetical protein